MNAAFFTLHSELPREGPGEPADVDWAMSLIRPAINARILDAGCGPGADVEALLKHVPQGEVVAVDLHAPFIAAVDDRYRGDARVHARTADMREAGGGFDVIWCAGALYFLGGAAGLPQLVPSLTETGAVAFSEPCFFVDTPSEAARAFWEGEDAAVGQVEEILQKTTSAGFHILGHRPLAPSAWEAYYAPMETRIAKLRGTGGADLDAVLDQAELEISSWRAVQTETGYLLVAARRA